MPRKTRFAVGQFAFSKLHSQLVRVLSKEGDSLTVATFPNNQALPGMVKETDLLTLRQFETWAKAQPVVQPVPQEPAVEPEPPMPIVIARTVYVPEVTDDGEVRRRVPLFKGQKFLVLPDYDMQYGLDWLRPVEGGGVLALPSDAWEVDTSDDE